MSSVKDMRVPYVSVLCNKSRRQTISSVNALLVRGCIALDGLKIPELRISLMRKSSWRISPAVKKSMSLVVSLGFASLWFFCFIFAEYLSIVGIIWQVRADSDVAAAEAELAQFVLERLPMHAQNLGGLRHVSLRVFEAA